jgi:hypothetical protein
LGRNAANQGIRKLIDVHGNEYSGEANRVAGKVS